MIKTSCRDCVLAEYDGPEQVGCGLGRVGKFEGQGVRVVGIDDGKLRHLVIDRYCNACHSPGWPFLEGVAPAGVAAAIREHIRLRYAYVVHAGPSATIDDIAASLAWASGLAIPPRATIVALHPDAPASPARVVAAVRDAAGESAWKVVRVEPREPDEVYPLASSFAMDEAVSKIDADDAPYYVPAEAGQCPPADLIDLLDAAINDELMPVSVVTGGGGILAVQVALHNHPEVVGNRGEPLSGKLDYIEENYPDVLILKYRELKDGDF